MKCQQSIFGLLLLLLAVPRLHAQQDFHTTQFVFNKLAINPAYAGADHVLSMTALYRNQWTGLEGAPSTLSFSAHSPIANNRMGVGLQLYDDRLGVSHSIGMFGAYNYKIPLGGSVLSLGLQAGLISLRNDLDEVDPLTPGDPVFAQGVNGIYPNAGFGVYWYKPGHAFAGLSIPRLIQNPVDDLVPGAVEQARLYRHSYLMGGYVFTINRNLRIRPTALFKWAGPAETGAPFDAEANVAALLMERLWVGIGWRASDAVSAQLEFLLTRQLVLGYAYDIGTSALAPYHNGSHEIMLQFAFDFERNGVVTPRRIKTF